MLREGIGSSVYDQRWEAEIDSTSTVYIYIYIYHVPLVAGLWSRIYYIVGRQQAGCGVGWSVRGIG